MNMSTCSTSKKTAKDLKDLIAVFSSPEYIYSNGYVINKWLDNNKNTHLTVIQLLDCWNIEGLESNLVKGRLHACVKILNKFKVCVHRNWEKIVDLLYTPFDFDTQRKRVIKKKTTPWKIKLEEEPEEEPPGKKLKTDCTKCPEFRQIIEEHRENEKQKMNQIVKEHKKEIAEMKIKYDTKRVNRQQQTSETTKQNLRIEKNKVKRENSRLQKRVNLLEILLKSCMKIPEAKSIIQNEKIKISEHLMNTIDVNDLNQISPTESCIISMTEKSPMQNVITLEGEKRELSLFTVDAFTDRAFCGNPVAVCLLKSSDHISDSERQNLSTEMNLSETVFVIPQESTDFLNGSKFNLRWFSPTKEIDLFGLDATLASAAVLFNEIGNRHDKIEFSSDSGPLDVCRSEDKMRLDFPLNPPVPVSQERLQQLLEYLVGDLSLIQEVQLSQTKKLLVRLKDEVNISQLAALAPRTNQMVECYTQGDINGVGVTLRGSEANGCFNHRGDVYDFVSRYFSPWLGISEDPVTGSWHSVAAAYWAKDLGKRDMYARHCSRRGGELWISMGVGRLALTGQAVVNLRGTFCLH